jgi:hypothetical protein
LHEADALKRAAHVDVGDKLEKGVADPRVDTTAAEAYESGFVPGVFGPLAEEVAAGVGTLR